MKEKRKLQQRIEQKYNIDNDSHQNIQHWWRFWLHWLKPQTMKILIPRTSGILLYETEKLYTFYYTFTMLDFYMVLIQ